MKPLVSKPEIRLAMLGMVDGNGHPYSWSAIFNGYDRELMAKCPFPTIPDYLSKQPPESFGIDGARITHVWTDDPADAPLVAAASKIEHVVDRPTDVIGQVDAVIIATDKGNEHVERARPFIEAGLPVFIDKPLADNLRDLKIFRDYVNADAPILSASSMRYAKEMAPYKISTAELGRLRCLSVPMPKSWERYGIHALETVYGVLGGGFVSVTDSGREGEDIMHIRHESGAHTVIASIYDMYGAFGLAELIGTAGFARVHFKDSFYSFRAMLCDFIKYLRTGERPIDFAETMELMKIVIAGRMSRQQGGREVWLDELEV